METKDSTSPAANGQDPLYAKRHSLAHVLAMAVLAKYPGTKLGIGPVIEHGFYYDFKFPEGVSPSPDDLASLTKDMRALVKKHLAFEGAPVSAKEARERFKNEPYKLDLISQYEDEGRELTVYTSGEFTDLCQGGHVENTKEIDPESFTLSHLAGAYWRGSEDNDMLTRIYGFAFETKDELAKFLAAREEAKKRDHRKIGKELDLFTFSDLVGPGLPLWTPKGTVLRKELDRFVKELRGDHFQEVAIPHFTKKELYETSGHWSKFADELFKVSTREGKEFAIKPMNCPHHTQIYNHLPRSYKEMPQRYQETTMVYRDEQSGELQGLTRVLSITQDDSHIFCRKSQVKGEFFLLWDIVDRFYTTLGFALTVRLSFHDPEHIESYLGTEEVWKEAEDALRAIAKERNAEYVEAPGEAAMYGPKLDFIAKDSLGREHQVATIQLDMNLPERFDLTCVNEKGEHERIVMLHSAIMGSIERFVAVYLEHTGGNLPLFLAPVQVKILPISDTHKEYAHTVCSALKEAGVRAGIDDSDETLGKKIRATKMEKVPYFLVIGDKEIADAQIMVEHRDKGKIGEMKIDELIATLAREITERT